MTLATLQSNWASSRRASLRRSTIGRTTMLVGCLLAGSLGVANADTAWDTVPTVVVSYGDLDLSTAAGAHTLYRRISAAAEQVCPFSDARELARAAMYHACRDAAIARAVKAVNSPQLAALQAERAKRG
jgi:UrcA family protein